MHCHQYSEVPASIKTNSSALEKEFLGRCYWCLFTIAGVIFAMVVMVVLVTVATWDPSSHSFGIFSTSSCNMIWFQNCQRREGGQTVECTSHSKTVVTGDGQTVKCILHSNDGVDDGWPDFVRTVHTDSTHLLWLPFFHPLASCQTARFVQP